MQTISPSGAKRGVKIVPSSSSALEAAVENCNLSWLVITLTYRTCPRRGRQAGGARTCGASGVTMAQEGEWELKFELDQTQGVTDSSAPWLPDGIRGRGQRGARRSSTSWRNGARAKS